MRTLQSKSIVFQFAHRLLVLTVVLVGVVSAAAQTNTFPSTGNVGIGTTSPVTNLHIADPAHSTVTLDAGAGSYDGSVLFRRGGVNKWFLQARNSGTPFDSFALFDAVNSSFRWVVDRNGNVGIGATTPTQRLEVAGTGLFTGTTITGNTAAGVYILDQNIYSLNGSNARDLNVLAQNLKFSTGTTYAEKMRIDVNGNVGIGTTDPSLGGVVASRFTVTQADASTGFSLGNTAGTPRFALNGNSNGTWTMWDYGTGSWTAGITQKSGSVGIGNVNPIYKLDVNGEINATGLRINGTPITGGGGSQWTGTSTIYYNGGSVGVGTTSPTRLFTLNTASNTYLGFNEGGAEKMVIGTEAAGYNRRFLVYDSSAAQYRFVIDNSGNVGIGTTSPNTNLVGAYSYPASVRVAQIDSTQARLVVRGSTDSGIDLIDANAAVKWMQLYNDAGITKFRSVDDSVNLKADNVVAMDNSTGNVGIGTAPTTYRLDVNGNTNITGNINVTGNINAKYQDVAEWVPSSEQLAAGTVVVLDTTKSNQVIASAASYDTRVAGVISAQPGITLGESGEGKVLVATTGRVRVKVDASGGPIQIGDLLVTSDISGVAMKSEPVEFAGRKMHMPGTIIGKALEPLAKGKGEILVLLSLQ